MRWSLACSLIASVACLSTLAPQTARATSCGPYLDSLVPTDGDPLPVTALPTGLAICGADMTGWEVDIDGEPATVTQVDPGFGDGWLAAVGIEPAPTEGAMVELRGCSYGCYEAEPEFDILRSYQVTGEDVEAPEPAPLLELVFADEIIDQYDFETEMDEQVAVRRWTLRFEPTVLEEPEIWIVEVGPGGGAGTRAVQVMEDGDEFVVVTRYVADAGQEVCATVSAYDLSGNAAQEAQVCVEVGEEQTLPDVPGEPDDDGGSGDGDGSSDGGSGGSTGDADGSGDDGSSGGDSSALDEGQGCSCSAGDRSPIGWSALLGLVVLGLRRRRD